MIRSFGVAGVLGEGCTVFHTTLFSSRHAGRVSDLIAARLKRPGLDELKLRTVLLITIFEALEAARARGALDSIGVTSRPLAIECGLDTEKVAVGVSLASSARFPFVSEGIEERIVGQRPEGVLEALLVDLNRASSRLVIRYCPETQGSQGVKLPARVDIVAILSLADLADSAVGTPVREAPLLIELTPEEAAQVGTQAKYEELGDLNYPELLREDGPTAKAGAGVNKPDTVKISGVTEHRNDERIVVSGAKDLRRYQDRIRELEREVVLLRKKALEGPPVETVTIIKGTTEVQAPEAVTIVKGSSAPAPDEGVTVIKGGAAVDMPNQEPWAVKSDKPAFLADDDEPLPNPLEMLFKTKIGQKLQPGAEKMGSLLKTVWPFKPKAPEPEALPAPGGDGPGADADVTLGESSTDLADPSSAEAELAAAPAVNTEAVAHSLMAELQAGRLESMLKTAKAQMGEIQREIPSAKGRDFVHGLMEGIVQEKARLAELAKKLNTGVRQKELELRNREMRFQDEIRKRDELLKQKGNQVARAKDQVQELQVALERARASQSQAAEDAVFRQKYALSQRLLNASKEENKTLVTKVEELNKALANVQAQAKSKGASVAEYTAMKEKFEKAQRQLDDFKRTNRQLMEKISERDRALQRESDDSELGELKQRLEASVSQATEAKRENERLLQVIDHRRAEEDRLNNELAAMREELASIKAKIRASRMGQAS